jgi:hypothetical protein
MVRIAFHFGDFQAAFRRDPPQFVQGRRGRGFRELRVEGQRDQAAEALRPQLAQHRLSARFRVAHGHVHRQTDYL